MNSSKDLKTKQKNLLFKTHTGVEVTACLVCNVFAVKEVTFLFKKAH